jgi:hypothetical protein
MIVLQMERIALSPDTPEEEMVFMRRVLGKGVE